jgi:hypothetical protein
MVLNAKEVEGGFFQFHATITPESTEEVNHLWQVGPEVSKDGIILALALNPENKHATGKLKLKGVKASSWLATVSF